MAPGGSATPLQSRRRPPGRPRERGAAMTTTSHRARGGVLIPLRHRDFRLLMGAFAGSAAGSWAYNVALAVFVYEQTHSPAWVGAATVGRFVPSLVFGAYGGVLAERFERVRLMTALDGISA